MVKLQDGTEIILFNQSELSYNEPFIDNKRDIQLKGKADFRVAKDKSKPFTVFSGDVSTTALGTRFIVTAHEKASNIIVTMYEGKILVKTAYRLRKELQKDFYLVPGDEFIYDKNKLTAKLRTFKGNNAFNKNKSNVDDMVSDDEPPLPKNEKGSWYMFNNQPLAQVLNELEDMYNVKITYSKKDVRNKYFIGRFNKSDSVEYILKQIAAVNRLKVIVESDRFVITK